ncbi:hypothetical protein PT2222_50138 [Paraburkholderia tropica]
MTSTSDSPSNGWQADLGSRAVADGDYRPLAAQHAEQQRDDEHDEEDVKQDLGDFRRARRNAGEAEHGGNERDHEKDDGVMKHGVVLPFFPWMRLMWQFAMRKQRSRARGQSGGKIVNSP